jgi:hypothetical protein
MMLYLAADQALDLLPWRADAPGFHVTELPAWGKDARDQFATPYVYYAGAHEGCGCGFQLGECELFDPDDPEEVQMKAAQRQSLLSLAAYVEDQLRRVDSLELLACWSGGEDSTPQHGRTLTPESFRSESFYFLDGERSRVEREAAQQ